LTIYKNVSIIIQKRKRETQVSILVIGGSGFFGRRLLIRLLQDTKVASVVSMDVVPPKETFKRSIERYVDRFRFVHGDVSQLEDVLSVMKSFSVQKVVNFAYVVGGNEIDTMPRWATKVNALGMCNVFEAARLLGVSRAIYASSMAVYGPRSIFGDREVTEEDHLHSTFTYGITKLLNEKMAEAYSKQYSMSIIGLRPSHGFGHGREHAGVSQRFSSIISLPAVGKPALLDVEGSTAYSLVCPEDVAELTKILLDAPSPKYNIYNVAGPLVTMQQVSDQIRQYIPSAQIAFGHGPRIESTLSEKDRAEFDLPEKISSARAKEEFGFSPIPLKDAVLIQINKARAEAGLELIKA
jgi:nucleoside-diphosphate-sugar epimerase